MAMRLEDEERITALARLTASEVFSVLAAHNVSRGDPALYDAVMRKIYMSLRNARLIGELRGARGRSGSDRADSGRQETDEHEAKTSPWERPTKPNLPKQVVVNRVDPAFDLRDTLPGIGPKMSRRITRPVR